MVQSPRLDLCNRELLLSHLNALAISEIGLPGLEPQIGSQPSLIRFIVDDNAASLSLLVSATGSRMLTSTLNRVKRMFPKLKTTRLRQVTDFYSLAFLIWISEQEGLILTDRRRNNLAWDLLRTFASRVRVRELQRKVKGARGRIRSFI